jgi:hypothetical protein
MKYNKELLTIFIENFLELDSIEQTRRIMKALRMPKTIIHVDELPENFILLRYRYPSVSRNALIQALFVT